MAGVLSAGQVLDGRYEILAPIAQGGMGAVYRARRLLLGDEVAIKIIRGDDVSPTARERFMRESRACARLRHPHIVSILDFDVDASGNPFLVMELLSGPSLKDELAARGRLDVAEVQRIIPSICAALQLAHANGIVHRDLKPANIVAHVFEQGDRVYKIVDFGVANVRESSDATRLTGAHQFVGTLTYASPEQLTGAQVDARSDIYSLGTVLYEMLTGVPPFAGTDAMSVVAQHLTSTVRQPSLARPGLPRWVDTAVCRALSKQPDDRWRSASELGALISAGDGEAATVARSFEPASGLAALYETGERLGSGRLGSEVFRGVHRALGHPVAIRILRRGGQRNWEGVRARFLREARTLQVSHPSIIQVRDFGEEDGIVYLVTDFIDGPSLRDVMTASGPMAWPRLRPLVEQLVEAARVLHRRKGLLCGLSPDIMRLLAATEDEGERLMISTAGIWQAQDLLATLDEQTLRGLGLADTELRYIAPELLTGRAGDVRSDVFTMAVLTYEMATGTRPYEGASMPALLGAMLAGVVADPRRAQPTLPDSAATALGKALQPDPAERFPSAKALGAALLADA
jgi:serine/threonine protein kinase